MFTIGHLYLLFLIIGALGLASSLIFGEVSADGDLDLHGDISGDTDHGDSDGPKVFSLRIIFSFLTAFGIGAGAIYLNQPTLTWLQLLVGLAAGLVTGAGTFYLVKFIYSFQGNSNVDSNSFIGKNAVVTIETTSRGLTQVRVDSDSANDLFMAQEVSGKKLSRLEIVKVTGKTGNTLLVTKQ